MSEDGRSMGNVTRLINGGKQGRLITPVGGQLPVRVFERGGDMLVLVLMLAAGEELRPDRVESVLLEYVSERGLVRFHGHAVLDEPDLVRFMVASDAEIVQRREFVRVEAVQPVVLSEEDAAEPVDAHALDLSGGGMLLNGPETLELDTCLRFRLHLGADKDPIEGKARVVRSAEDGRRGLVFDQISGTDRQRLIHFIFECQRIALAKVTHNPPLQLRRGKSR
jgi:hypothetical protein